MGISWAVVEDLALRTQAHVLVTTHYHELGSLAKSLPQVRNMSMAVDVEGSTGQAGQSTGSGEAPLPSLSFRFTLSEGSTSHKTDYGLALAALCGLPEPVLQDARGIKAHLAHRIAANGMRPGTSMLAGLARPATAVIAVRTAADGPGHQAGVPSSFASAVAARDALLFTVCNELLPVLDSIENGAASVDEVYSALQSLQAQYGPALASVGVDGTLAQSMVGPHNDGSVDGSHASILVQGTVAQESMCSSGMQQSEASSFTTIPSSIDTSRPGTAASVLLVGGGGGRGQFTGFRFQQPPTPATDRSALPAPGGIDEDDMPYRDPSRGGAVIGSRDSGVQYSQDLSMAGDTVGSVDSVSAAGVNKPDPVRGRMAPPPLPPAASGPSTSSLRPLPWHRPQGHPSVCRQGEGATSLPPAPVPRVPVTGVGIDEVTSVVPTEMHSVQPPPQAAAVLHGPPCTGTMDTPTALKVQAQEALKGTAKGQANHDYVSSPAQTAASPDGAVTAVNVSAVTVVDNSGASSAERTVASDRIAARTEGQPMAVPRDTWMDALDQLF